MYFMQVTCGWHHEPPIARDYLAPGTTYQVARQLRLEELHGRVYVPYAYAGVAGPRAQGGVV